MKLHRYKLKEDAEPMHFGPRDTSHTWEFEWFYSPVQAENLPEEERIKHISKIGLCGLPIPKDTCVIANLFLGHEPLIVSQNSKKPIHRMQTQDKFLDTRTSGMEEVSRLVDFLKQHKEYHLFMSSTGSKDGNHRLIPNITTFSTHSPSKEIYSPIQSLNIEFKGRFYRPSLEKVFRYFPFQIKKTM